YDDTEFPELIRSGNEQGLLLGDWGQWRLYRAMRGKTSHTYDESIALEVVHGIPKFLDEARHLHSQLAKRQE
ncbi:MAG: nucleotidyltransferase substrate binding protein, partial [Candidatus Zixiibacteriota bacterium]